MMMLSDKINPDNFENTCWKLASWKK